LVYTGARTCITTDTHVYDESLRSPLLHLDWLVLCMLSVRTEPYCVDNNPLYNTTAAR
jgi:hypothetical protein